LEEADTRNCGVRTVEMFRPMKEEGEENEQKREDKEWTYVYIRSSSTKFKQLACNAAPV
jgi:hypothetical protein